MTISPALIFVHGSHSGRWIWDDTIDELSRLGIEATAIDLAGYGVNKQRPPGLHENVAIVHAAIEACCASPILVGHSMGGLVITQAASESSKVAGLVYLAAFVPQDGDTLADVAARDPSSQVSRHRRIDSDRHRAELSERAMVEIFFSDQPPDRYRLWLPRFTADPLDNGKPCLLNAERLATIPAAYLECGKSLAISLEYQRKMQLMRHFVVIWPLNYGHFPMLESPWSLAAELASVVAQLSQSNPSKEFKRCD